MNSNSTIKFFNTQKQIMPEGVVEKEVFDRLFADFLVCQNNTISSTQPMYFTKTLPFAFPKLSIVVEILNYSLLGDQNYKISWKHQSEIPIMTVTKKMFTNYQFFAIDEQEPQHLTLLGKMTYSTIRKEYLLYEKTQWANSKNKGICELGLFKLSNVNMIILPKATSGQQVKRVIVPKEVNHLEKQYTKARSRLTCLKLHERSVNLGNMKRRFYSLMELENGKYHTYFAARKVNEQVWEVTFGYPLSFLQTAALVVCLIGQQ